MGEQLITIGSMPPAAFKAFVYGLYVKSCLNVACDLEKLVSDGPLCRNREYESVVLSIVRKIREEVTEEENIIPRDLVAIVSGNQEAMEEARRSVLMFGRVMCYWENIVDAARNRTDYLKACECRG